MKYVLGILLLCVIAFAVTVYAADPVTPPEEEVTTTPSPTLENPATTTLEDLGAPTSTLPTQDTVATTTDTGATSSATTTPLIEETTASTTETVVSTEVPHPEPPTAPIQADTAPDPHPETVSPPDMHRIIDACIRGSLREVYGNPGMCVRALREGAPF